jgi:hypothetical protein
MTANKGLSEPMTASGTNMDNHRLYINAIRIILPFAAISAFVLLS